MAPPDEQGNETGAEENAPSPAMLDAIKGLLSEQLDPVLNQLRGDVSGLQSLVDQTLQTGKAMKEHQDAERAAAERKARHQKILAHIEDDDERAKVAAELAAQDRADAKARQDAAAKQVIEDSKKTTQGDGSNPGPSKPEDKNLASYKEFARDNYGLDPESDQVMAVWTEAVAMAKTQDKVKVHKHVASKLLALAKSDTTSGDGGNGGDGGDGTVNPPEFSGGGQASAAQMTVDEINDKWLAGEMTTDERRTRLAELAGVT